MSKTKDIELVAKIEQQETKTKTKNVGEQEKINAKETYIKHQDYSTDFKYKQGAVVNYTKKYEDKYREMYIDNDNKLPWYKNGVYCLGFSFPKKNYHLSIIDTYNNYIFEDLELNENVILEKTIKDITKKVLKYGKILIRVLKSFENIYLEAYNSSELDQDNRVIVEYKNELYINYYDDERGGYVYEFANKDLPVIERQKRDKSRELNKNFMEQPNLQFFINLDELDIIKKVMPLLHQIDRFEARYNLEAFTHSTISLLPDQFTESWFEGAHAFRKVETTANDKNYIEPKYIEYPKVASELQLIGQKLMDDLTRQTHINFLGVAGNEMQTATEFAGKQKPFAQAIKEINMVLLEQINKIYLAVAELKNIQVDDLMVPPFEFQDQMQFSKTIEQIEKIRSIKLRVEALADLYGRADDEQFKKELTQEYEKMETITDVGVGEF